LQYRAIAGQGHSKNPVLDRREARSTPGSFDEAVESCPRDGAFPQARRHAWTRRADASWFAAHGYAALRVDLRGSGVKTHRTWTPRRTGIIVLISGRKSGLSEV